jgi:hypothetical protein
MTEVYTIEEKLSEVDISLMGKFRYVPEEVLDNNEDGIKESLKEWVNGTSLCGPEYIFLKSMIDSFWTDNLLEQYKGYELLLKIVNYEINLKNFLKLQMI